MPANVHHGPLTTNLVNAAQQKWQDSYPSLPCYANECEDLLNFAKAQGQHNRFWGRLTAKKQQRDEALEELRVAYFFDTNGSKLISWDPPGANNHVGEFLIGSPGKKQIFVEVKSPGWESELTDAELKAGRARQPKYLGIEGRSYDPVGSIRRAINNAYPKFSENWANLLVISDDFFVSLEHGTLPIHSALYESRTNACGEIGCFTNDKFKNLGGLGIFSHQCTNTEVKYALQFYLNNYCPQNTCLPITFFQ